MNRISRRELAPRRGGRWSGAGWLGRVGWSRVLFVVVVVVGSLSGTGAASAANPAVCQFDLRGTAGDNSITPVPVAPLTDQERYVTYTLSGPVSCSGAGSTRQLPTRPGQMTATSTDVLPDPLSSGGSTNSCGAGAVDLAVTVTWPGRHASVDKGVVRFAWIAGEALLEGQLDGFTLLGRGGIGGNPDKPYGNCTDEHPYTYWSLVGEFVLASTAAPAPSVARVVGAGETGARGLGAGGSANNYPILINTYQYLGGGTVDSFSTTDPSPSVTLFGLRVQRGDTITFTNIDAYPHTVTSCLASKCGPAGPAVILPPPSGQPTSPNPLPNVLRWQGESCFDLSCSSDGFDSGTRLDQPGSSYTIQTSKLRPGTYYFICEFHRFMRGSFTVVGSTSATRHQRSSLREAGSPGSGSAVRSSS